MRGRRGLSVVVSALIVTGIILAIFSALFVAGLTLSQAANRSLRMEVEKVYERLQAYKLNSTHIMLDNSRSPVGVVIKYVVEISGSNMVTNQLSPPWTVSAGETKIVSYPTSSGTLYKLVSERGNIYMLGNPPGGLGSGFTVEISPDTISVQATFSGVASTITLTAGPDYPGDPVDLITGPIIPSDNCFTSISYSPDPVNLPPGSTATSDVSLTLGGAASCPEPSYNIVIYAKGSGGQTEQVILTVNIIATPDFIVELIPSTVTLNPFPWFDFESFTIKITSINGYSGTVDITISSPTCSPRCWIIPTSFSNVNVPANGVVTRTATVYAIWTAPSGTYTATVTVTDGTITKFAQLTIVIL